MRGAVQGSEIEINTFLFFIVIYMFQRELAELGMTHNEATIYESILELGEASVSEISKRSAIHRRSVYDTLERLIEKGIIFPIFGQKENLYVATDPAKLLEMIEQKEQTIRKILPYLEKIQAKSGERKEAAFIYRGLEGYKNYMRDMSRVAEDTYFLGAKGNWLTPGVSFGLEEHFQSALRRSGKKVQIIFDPRVRARTDIQSTAAGEYRFLPAGYETSGVVDVFGDYVVTFNSVGIGNFGESGSIFVMINPELAESYRTWFRFVWDFCEKE
jgi:sugar-specific transcriptional regulator TrmB